MFLHGVCNSIYSFLLLGYINSPALCHITFCKDFDHLVALQNTMLDYHIGHITSKYSSEQKVTSVLDAMIKYTACHSVHKYL